MTSSALVERIQAHEGYSAKPYYDTEGVLTVGWGTNIQHMSVESFDCLFVGALYAELCKPENHALWLYERIEVAEIDAKKWLGADYDALSPGQQEVVVEMAYNLGYPRLAGFKQLRQAIKRKDYERARAEMLDSRWARQVGKRANTLADIFYQA